MNQHATIEEFSGESTFNDRGSVGNGVFYAVHAEVI
jgi:hypothetical protein